MDSEDEMIVQMMEDEQAFEDDLREHLSVVVSLQNMLDTGTEKRKRLRRRGSKAGRKKSKPQQRIEGHTMLHNNYFVDGAT
ncbi:hypothetical protein QYE76_040177 [Lolium multiflorum]|uniref:Uncharacterized protein n=1 Tax=Lolium multiflorum TaxID=4521 RepID=A0AAD8TB37_LOLMU|nr:hypothetical protein QYE76_040177 [Lolium multiflorum]